MKTTALLALTATALLPGCRTIWLHPDATVEKYEDDKYFCQHGVERGESEPGVQTESERAWALSISQARADWKQCMVRLGWETIPGARWLPPVMPSSER